MLNNSQVFAMLEDITNMYEEKKQELSQYDAVIGDGDHGYSISRGCKAGFDSILNLDKGKTIGELFKVYGRELTNEVGGAMGPLFGLLFTEIGKACGDSEQLGLKELARGLKNASLSICDLGGARVGDKTMVDAIIPTVYSLERSYEKGLVFLEALELAVEAGKRGLDSTVPLISKRGRSKYLKERSVGYQDAGATSFYYLIKEIRDYTACV